MALEHLYELVEEVQDLQEAAKSSVEPDKVRALARLVLELAQAVEDLHDRLQKLEAASPQSTENTSKPPGVNRAAAGVSTETASRTPNRWRKQGRRQAAPSCFRFAFYPIGTSNSDIRRKGIGGIKHRRTSCLLGKPRSSSLIGSA